MYGGPALIPVILKPSLSEKEAAPGRLFLVSLDAAPGGGIRAATPEEIYERVAAATCGQEAEAAGRPWFATMSSTGPDPDGPDEIMLHGRRASLPRDRQSRFASAAGDCTRPSLNQRHHVRKCQRQVVSHSDVHGLDRVLRRRAGRRPFSCAQSGWTSVDSSSRFPSRVTSSS
jgi:hypothetical protein